MVEVTIATVADVVIVAVVEAEIATNATKKDILPENVLMVVVSPVVEEEEATDKIGTKEHTRGRGLTTVETTTNPEEELGATQELMLVTTMPGVLVPKPVDGDEFARPRNRFICLLNAAY